MLFTQGGEGKSVLVQAMVERGYLRLSISMDADEGPVRCEALCGFLSELSLDLGSEGREMSSRGLRISSHELLGVGTVEPPLSRKASSAAGSVFISAAPGKMHLPALTSEPVSPPLLQALAHPCCYTSRDPPC